MMIRAGVGSSSIGRVGRALRRGVAGVLCAVGVCLGGAGGFSPRASAHVLAEPPELELAEVFAALPADVELVVGVNDAVNVRRRPIGLAVASALSSAGVTTELTPAWEGLAKELGIGELELFDALMGRRVVLATRLRTSGAGGAAVREWALLCQVSTDIEQRVRERLQATPRSIDAGHQVLAIEKGAYALVTHRVPGAKTSTLVFAPSQRDGLLTDIVLRFSAAGGGGAAAGAAKGEKSVPALRTSGVMDAIAKASAPCVSPDVLVLARLDEAPSGNAGEGASPVAVGQDPWARCVVLAGRCDVQDGRTWQSRVVVRRGAGAARVEIPETSDAVIRNMEARTLLTIVESAAAGDVLREFRVPRLDLLSILPLPGSAKPLATGRRALWVREVQPRDRVCVGISTETSAPDELAKSMDGAIARFVKSMEERFGAVGEPPLDFAGATPTAVRVLPIRSPEEGGGIPLVSSEPLVACWSYPRVALAPGEDRILAGWWAMEVSQHKDGDLPQPQKSFAESQTSLTSVTPESQMGRWAMLAWAKPAALERLLSPTIPDLRGFRTTMRKLEAFRLRLSATDTADLVGDLSITLADEPKDGAAERREPVPGNNPSR